MGFNACKKNDEVKSLNSLEKDDKFKALVENRLQLLEQIKDGEKAIKIINRTNLSVEDLDTFAKAIGFQNLDAYKQYIARENASILTLKKDYNLSLYTEREIVAVATRTINSINTFGKTSPGMKLMGVQDNCERKRRNCLVSVAATATAAHIACAATDPTIVVGIICHGAAVAYQIAEGDNCNAAAVDCYKEQKSNIISSINKI